MKRWVEMTEKEKALLFAATFALDPSFLSLGHVMCVAEEQCSYVKFACTGRDQHGGWNCEIFANDGRHFTANAKICSDALAQALLKTCDLPEILWTQNTP